MRNERMKNIFDNSIILQMSSAEMVLKNILDNIGVEYIYRDSTYIDNASFYIPDKNIIIDVLHNKSRSVKYTINRKLQLDNLNKCNELGITLIQIFEDEILNKSSIVRNRIKAKLGMTKYSIYARKCTIEVLDLKEKNIFFDKYHIQGHDLSQIRLGLKYKNRLVAIMTFCKLRKSMGRKSVEGSYELSRYATVANFNVIGGAGKLFKYFKNNYINDLKKIISYTDLRWNTGKLYENIGFKLVKENTGVCYFYIHQDYNNYLKRFNRFNFRKNILNEKLKIFDKNKTEFENMDINGYLRIYDCGCKLFELNI